MAPSSTRMRVLIRSRNADRALLWDAFTTIDSGSADRLHCRPQAQQMADCEHEVGPVHRVEMERGNAAVHEVDHLLGGNRSCDQLARGGIVVEAVEALGDPGRN